MDEIDLLKARPDLTHDEWRHHRGYLLAMLQVFVSHLDGGEEAMRRAYAKADELILHDRSLEATGKDPAS